MNTNTTTAPAPGASTDAKAGAPKATLGNLFRRPETGSFIGLVSVFAFFADVGVGLAYFLAENAGMGIGDMTRHTFDYGTTYLWVAGLLNYLIVLDAFDIAQGRKP